MILPNNPSSTLPLQLMKGQENSLNVKFSRSQFKAVTTSSTSGNENLGQLKQRETIINASTKFSLQSPDISKQKSSHNSPSLMYCMEQKENFKSQGSSENLATRFLASPRRLLNSPKMVKENNQDKYSQFETDGKQICNSTGVIYKTKAFSKFNIPYNAFGKNAASSLETSPNVEEGKSPKHFYSPNLETKTSGKYKQHLQQIFSARLNKHSSPSSPLTNTFQERLTKYNQVQSDRTDPYLQDDTKNGPVNSSSLGINQNSVLRMFNNYIQRSMPTNDRSPGLNEDTTSYIKRVKGYLG